MNNKVYDALKKNVLIWLPALATLYSALGQIWGIPKVEAVVLTITALTTFLGVLLHVSTNLYKSSGAAYDGEIHITPQVDGPTQLALEMKSPDPLSILDKGAVTFKVNPPTAPVAPVAINPADPTPFA